MLGVTAVFVTRTWSLLFHSYLPVCFGYTHCQGTLPNNPYPLLVPVVFVPNMLCPGFHPATYGAAVHIQLNISALCPTCMVLL